MNAVAAGIVDAAPAEFAGARFDDLACAALALQCAAAGGSEALQLRDWQRWPEATAWRRAHAASRRAPAAQDRDLLRLAAALALSDEEVLAVAFVARLERDAAAGAVVAWLQAPRGGARATLGLLARLLEVFGADEQRIAALAAGAAVTSGLLQLGDEHLALPDRRCAIALPLLRALAGAETPWPQLPQPACAAIALPPRVREAAQDHACVLAAQQDGGLLLRSASPAEAASAAGEIAAALGRRPLFLPWPLPALPAGLEPWLILRRRLPVFVCDPGPGERIAVPAFAAYRGPVLASCGLDGGVRPPLGSWPEWTLPMPDRGEREALWREALGAAEAAAPLAGELAARYRQGAGRIAQLAALGRRRGGAGAPTLADIGAAAWVHDAGGLDGLASPLAERVDDAALVVSETLRDELALLLARCRARDGLVAQLGSAARARYHCGVRALFCGPSGTGKSLAVQWLATQLGMPLYRVDLAAVTSKWIGETEKNLARLLASAEHADAMLLFDEADALFGKRTDVNDANDRHANAQTNYLLQRIESYDGLIVLTSNSRSRFDSAFTRRLDAIVEFAAPDAEQRHGLWRAHLGDAHALDALQLNHLATHADLCGGHLRNAVLTAALLAAGAGRAIAYDDVVRGLRAEYRKLGRPLPGALQDGAP